MKCRCRIELRLATLLTLTLLLAATGMPGAAATGAAVPARPPNIVYILTDDLSMNLVEFMPRVRDMQAQGVTFSNSFVSDSFCCPSRASIFTGRFPHNTGIFTNTAPDGGFKEFRRRHHERTTFAVALQAAGYRTAMLGKYLNLYQPADHPPEPGWTLWAVGGDEYEQFDYDLNENGRVVHYDRAPTDYQTDVLAGMAERFIRESAGAPFMIEVATYSPHSPYTPAPRDADAFPRLAAPRTAAFNAAHEATQPHWLRLLKSLPRPPLDATEIAGIDSDFRKRAQAVLAVDALIGRLQGAVAAIGEQDNTYFVFNSDNGYHMGEFGLMPQKQTAYDTDIHVPLVVTGPGIPAGHRVEEFVQNIDLHPTFVELGGARAAANVDGRSLVPLLHAKPVRHWRNLALVEHHGPATDPADPDYDARGYTNPPGYAAIRGSGFLYVEYVDGDREYHDALTDPDQLHNTYQSLSQKDKTILHEALQAVQRCRGARSCSTAARLTRGVGAR